MNTPPYHQPETEMTPEQKRIAIAKACGWKKISIPLCGPRWASPIRVKANDFYSSLRDCEPLPDYLNDLNAMRDAFLTLPEGVHVTYGRKLQDIMGECLVGYVPSYPEDFTAIARMANASAEQLADAFIQTLNLDKP